MTFDVAAEKYGRFMGRYSGPLAVEFLALVDLAPGARVLDVGCGPGTLTTLLVDRLGADTVSAVDPSEPFVAAVRERLPGVDVRRASAEELPYADDTFDAALAELVVHFMTDPVAGIREMARVTRPGGPVAACVWDYAVGRAPLSLFWKAACELDPDATDESDFAGAREGHLAQLFEQAGLRDITSGEITAHVRVAGFEDWWEPFTLGVGPAGDHVASLDEDAVARLRARCAELVPDEPFELAVTAWSAVGTAG